MTTTPEERIDQAVNSSIHRLLNDRLRAAGRGGFGTVNALLHERLFTDLIRRDEIQGGDLRTMVHAAVTEATADVIREVGYERGRLLNDIERLNDSIDSRRLARYIDHQKEKA